MSHVCPAWLGYLLLCPLRRLIQNPDTLLRPYISPGMTILEIGPGMGYFTLPMARLVGPTGKILCVDVQPKMLAGLQRRAAKAAFADRIITRLCSPTSLAIGDFTEKIDFALAFAVVHEAPDARALFADIHRALRPTATLLIAEPRGHVSTAAFDHTLSTAAATGLTLTSRPPISHSHTALLRK